MGSLDDLISDLKGFDGRKEVVKQLRTELRKPVPEVRRAIRQRALIMLPKRGGLNVYVAKASVTAQVKLAGRSAGVRLRGKKKSDHPRRKAPVVDLRGIDKGKVRHPSWGRRDAGSWHTQSVPAGFFTGPAGEVDKWRQAAVQAVDKAAEVIRRG